MPPPSQTAARLLRRPHLPANCAGVPHLEGGCEQGAVCCSPGAMKAVDGAPSSSACRLQDAVSSGVADPVSAENPRAWDGEYLKKVLREVREFHPDWFIEEVGGWIGIMYICTW